MPRFYAFRQGPVYAFDAKDLQSEPTYVTPALPDASPNDHLLRDGFVNNVSLNLAIARKIGRPFTGAPWGVDFLSYDEALTRIEGNPNFKNPDAIKERLQTLKAATPINGSYILWDPFFVVAIAAAFWLLVCATVAHCADADLFSGVCETPIAILSQFEAAAQVAEVGLLIAAPCGYHKVAEAGH